MVIDEIDREILRQLTIDGRMSYRQLGENVGLSSTAAAARMERLADCGVISGYQVRIDQRALGNMIHAIVDIKFNHSTFSDKFVENLAEMDNVANAWCVTGPFDCRLEIWSPSPEDLNQSLLAIKQTGDVAELQTRLVLSSLKA